MRGVPSSIMGGFLATILLILIYLNFSWLMIAIVATSLITGGLAAVVSESRDNIAGILLGSSTAITFAIPIISPVQGVHIIGLFLSVLSTYLILNSTSDY